MSSSAADSGMKPPGNNASAQNIDVNVETTSDQASSLGKRRAGLRARKVPGSVAAASEDDALLSGDEGPSRKKVKTAAAPKPAQQWSKRRVIAKGTRIAVHKLGDDELPVYALYYQNGTLNCRTYREEAAPEVKQRHESFFSTGAQLTMDKIILDMNIFDKIGAKAIQSLKAEKQKEHIRTYLATL